MKLAHVFSDGMVLQHDRPICIFGEGNGTVTASFLGETVCTEADGKFRLYLSPHPAGGPYELTVTSGSETTVIRDVWVGEVILISGQSNAELPILETDDRDTHFDADDCVRMYMVTRPTDDEDVLTYPLETPYNEKWTSLTPENAGDWTAIGLHTALYYAKKLGMHVGILACYKGASAIQTFLSEEDNARFPRDPAQIHEDHTIYPWNIPSYLYHKMFETIFHYGVGSLVWYQGESNRTLYEAGFYDEMLIALMKELRRQFEDETMPAAIIQINKFRIPCEPGVLAIREAQERAVKRISNCRLVRIDDMGQHDGIHPTNKREVAARVCAALDELKRG